jgi:hypothetical protein
MECACRSARAQSTGGGDETPDAAPHKDGNEVFAGLDPTKSEEVDSDG